MTSRDHVTSSRDHLEIFQVDTAEEISNVPPCEMRNKFTIDEVKKAVKKLKTGKAAGIDELKAEQLKHSPDLI